MKPRTAFFLGFGMTLGNACHLAAGQPMSVASWGVAAIGLALFAYGYFRPWGTPS